MSGDVEIDRWLGEQGYSIPAARAQARAALEEAGLTRPGKLRFSEEKLARAEALLAERFFRHCTQPACTERAKHSGRTPVDAEPRSRCDVCGGSHNRFAEQALLEACRRTGVTRVVIVGGSPSVREELERALSTALQLRCIDGTERRTTHHAKSDVEWADLVLLWGSSELHHKVSGLYTSMPPPQKKKIVHVARRGIAALLEAAVEHLSRRADLSSSR